METKGWRDEEMDEGKLGAVGYRPADAFFFSLAT
jgi:hypothetical protein